MGVNLMVRQLNRWIYPRVTSQTYCLTVNWQVNFVPLQCNGTFKMKLFGYLVKFRTMICECNRVDNFGNEIETKICSNVSWDIGFVSHQFVLRCFIRVMASVLIV